MNIDEAIQEVAAEFVTDYIRMRVDQGATNEEIKAEIQGFSDRWCL